MVNLFDLWIVVVVALIIALIETKSSLSESAGAAERAAQTAEFVPADAQKLPKYRASEAMLTGRGERLGTAYRLDSGEVVYVPIGQPPATQRQPRAAGP
ncbi:MAG: DUF2149 domain-containing protein [Pirellulales bacterium]|nr:DUF2149 domain-containing protein [Pirellulales bacterium]